MQYTIESEKDRDAIREPPSSLLPVWPAYMYLPERFTSRKIIHKHVQTSLNRTMIRPDMDDSYQQGSC
jgi:hypothetical protein